MKQLNKLFWVDYMSNNDYWIELIQTKMSTRKGMGRFHAINEFLRHNTKKTGIFRMPTEMIQYIRREKDRIRRAWNNEVYATDDALKYQHYAELTTAKGWTKIVGMRKHDNPPGEGTE